MTRRDAVLWGGLALTLGLTAWAALLPDEMDAASSPVRAPVASSAASLVPAPTLDPRPHAGHADGDPGARSPWPAPPAVALAAWSALPSAGTENPPADETSPSSDQSPAAPTQETQEAQVAQEVPTAPPLPWRWLGRLDDGAGSRALLDGPGGARLVREADVLDGQWRVDRITSDQMRWTWLPAGLPRTLNRP